MFEKLNQNFIDKINGINALIKKSKIEIREKLPKIYSKDLIEILFSHPYTKIEFLVDYLQVHRETAWKYLKELEKIGFVKWIKIWKWVYYINLELFEILKQWYNY